MAHDIFISYSSKDKTIADAICSRLENNGIRCWIAPRDILPGETWGNAIINGINNCNLVIIVFSSHSNASGQVINEIERSVSKGKIIIPVRIEDITPTGDMELFLARRHWLDAMTPPLEAHIAKLSDTIFNLLGLQPKTRKPAKPENRDEPAYDKAEKNTAPVDIPVQNETQKKTPSVQPETKAEKNIPVHHPVPGPSIGSPRVLSNTEEIHEDTPVRIGDVRLIPDRSETGSEPLLKIGNITLKEI